MNGTSSRFVLETAWMIKRQWKVQQKVDRLPLGMSNSENAYRLFTNRLLKVGIKHQWFIFLPLPFHTAERLPESSWEQPRVIPFRKKNPNRDISCQSQNHSNAVTEHVCHVRRWGRGYGDDILTLPMLTVILLNHDISKIRMQKITDAISTRCYGSIHYRVVIVD